MDDADELEVGVASVEISVAAMATEQQDGIERTQREARRGMSWMRTVAGNNLFDESWDGAYYEALFEPSLRVLLNLMETSFSDLEVLWWIYRRGVRSGSRKRRRLKCGWCRRAWIQGRTNPGLVRIDETDNCVVHAECWEQYLKDSGEEALHRGIAELGAAWSHFLRHRAADDTGGQQQFHPYHGVSGRE